MNTFSKKLIPGMLTLLMLIIVAGCASNDPVALEQERVLQEKRSQVVALHIVDEVDIVSVPLVMTPSKVWGTAMGGLIGASIAASDDTANEGAYVKFLKDNNIDLKSIVRDALKRTLAEKRPDLQLVDDPAAPSLKINIRQYGIVGKSKLSVSDVRPLLKIHLKLTADDLLLWSGGSAGQKKRDESDIIMTYDEFIKNPEKLKQAYIAVANQAALALLVGINRTIPAKVEL